jgi:hypothetical protein
MAKEYEFTVSRQALHHRTERRTASCTRSFTSAAVSAGMLVASIAGLISEGRTMPLRNNSARYAMAFSRPASALL